jgi:hypothetical protein
VVAGSQPVAMTTSGAASKQLVCAEMTSTAGTTIAVAGVGSGTSASAANPSWTISGLPPGVALEAFEVIHSGLQTMTMTPAASWVLITAADLVSQGRGFAQQSVPSASTTLTCGWTAATPDDFVGASVAFYQVGLPSLSMATQR